MIHYSWRIWSWRSQNRRKISTSKFIMKKCSKKEKSWICPITWVFIKDTNFQCISLFILKGTSFMYHTIHYFMKNMLLEESKSKKDVSLTSKSIVEITSKREREKLDSNYHTHRYQMFVVSMYLVYFIL